MLLNPFAVARPILDLRRHRCDADKDRAQFWRQVGDLLSGLAVLALHVKGQETGNAAQRSDAGDDQAQRVTHGVSLRCPDPGYVPPWRGTVRKPFPTPSRLRVPCATLPP